MTDTVPPIVAEGRNCWRIEGADAARLIVDAADYYALLARLMDGAKERVLLIGWDFDTRISLLPGSDGKGESLGHYMLRLAKERPDRDIDILRWNFGALKHFAIPRILAMILRHYRVALAPGHTPVPVAQLTVRGRDGIRLTLTPRKTETP